MLQKIMSKFYLILLFVLPFLYCAISEKELKKYMQSLYGENKEISGDYDQSLSTKCNNGIFVGKKTGNVISYKGIPYAKPPIDDLRWRNPVLAEDNSKVYEAYYFGKSPIQTEYYYQPGSYYPQSEDCLFLNIWVNTKDTSNNKAVLVFIHGGSFGWDATSNPIFEGHNLIEAHPDAILVTIGYRLGLLGFLNLTSIPGGENYKTSSNLGLLDMICALKWINKNIANFGGDPDNVTIMGQSSGATSALLLPIIEGSEGLFKRIIAQSGSPSITGSVIEAKLIINKFMKIIGDVTMDDLLSLSEEEIKEINKKMKVNSYVTEREGNNIPLDLYEEYKSEKFKDIDILLGTNKDESRYWMKSLDYITPLKIGKFLYKKLMPVLYESDLKKMSDEDKKIVEEFMNLQKGKKIWKITEFYNEIIFRLPANRIAEYHSQLGGKTYLYQFRYGGEDELIGACHGIDLFYIFGNFELGMIAGKKVNNELSSTIQNMWINFAKTGNPSTPEHTWEQYDNDKKKMMVLDEKIEMVENYKSEQTKLLEPLLKYYLHGNYDTMSYNVPQVYKIVAQLISTLLLIILLLSFIIKLFK